ncbi:hypothetical protein B0H14DRAFT_3885965 [Mycena olivaceomarginata]|nr:hypothetical protein B0H14DRAFT_3885965 [Mycena olivaceomarginata]
MSAATPTSPIVAYSTALIWAIAAAELGLTATRIHFTRSQISGTTAIVAELLVTSILTLFWVPLTLLFHRRAPGIDNVHNNVDGNLRGNRHRYGGLHHESSGNLVLWIMWLVGAAIAAHRWPTRRAVGFGRQADILITLVALALVEFGLMTLVKVLALMEYSAWAPPVLVARVSDGADPDALCLIHDVLSPKLVLLSTTLFTLTSAASLASPAGTFCYPPEAVNVSLGNPRLSNHGPAQPAGPMDLGLPLDQGPFFDVFWVKPPYSVGPWSFVKNGSQYLITHAEFPGKFLTSVVAAATLELDDGPIGDAQKWNITCTTCSPVGLATTARSQITLSRTPRSTPGTVS